MESMGCMIFGRTLTTRHYQARTISVRILGPSASSAGPIPCTSGRSPSSLNGARKKCEGPPSASRIAFTRSSERNVSVSIISSHVRTRAHQIPRPQNTASQTAAGSFGEVVFYPVVDLHAPIEAGRSGIIVSGNFGITEGSRKVVERCHGNCEVSIRCPKYAIGRAPGSREPIRKAGASAPADRC